MGFWTMAGNFQVEDIILHLKELRQEKVRNDQVLKNLQQERKQLEKKVEAGKLGKINLIISQINNYNVSRLIARSRTQCRSSIR